MYLGSFDNEISAAKKYHGEFAGLNFPEIKIRNELRG